MDVWNCIFIEKCEFLARLLVNLNYFQGIIVSKAPQRITYFFKGQAVLGSIWQVHEEISGTGVFHRFLFIRSIHKRVGEQNLLCKTFIYYDNKFAAFIFYRHWINCSCDLQLETASTQTTILSVPWSRCEIKFVSYSEILYSYSRKCLNTWDCDVSCWNFPNIPF